VPPSSRRIRDRGIDGSTYPGCKFDVPTLQVRALGAQVRGGDSRGGDSRELGEGFEDRDAPDPGHRIQVGVGRCVADIPHRTS
jgi:hypothetical protein